MVPRILPDPDDAPQGPPAMRAAILPSRRAAADACRRAIRRGHGPLLLTGAAGSGKTWLWRHLALDADGGDRWIGVDAAPDLDGPGLCRVILRGIGRVDAAPIDDPRTALRLELAEQADEGMRWSLALDEGQNASDAALEEFRLLSNRLGTSEGFRSMLLSGRTGLARRLGERVWASLEGRLSSHVRLGPIDAEDAEFLLGGSPDRSPSRAEIERLHARSGGNPARLIRMADARDDRPVLDVPIPLRRPEPIADPDHRPGALTVGERPPLRFEDGMIEVGWDDADADADEPLDIETAADAMAGSRLEARLLRGASASEDAASRRRTPPEGTAPIVDTYAALQAEAEWARAVASAGRLEGIDRREYGPSIRAERAEESPTLRPGKLRAENGQEFAPYGRLFAQLNAAGDSD